MRKSQFLHPFEGLKKGIRTRKLEEKQIEQKKG